MLAGVVVGNNLKEGIDREVGKIRQNTGLAIQKLVNNCDESEIELNKQKRRRRIL